VPATTITINREQRDGLYELVRNHLGSVGDLFDALECEKDFGKAERLGLELIEDLRLLQDLGWDEDEEREEVELTIPAHDLMEVLERLRGEAGLVLGDAQESREDAETMRRFKQGYETCDQLLTAIDPREGSGTHRKLGGKA
jgi:uncharacterized protein YgfB (UPF0149 family)